MKQADVMRLALEILAKDGVHPAKASILAPSALRVTESVTVESDGNLHIVRGPRGSGKTSLLNVVTHRAVFTRWLTRVPTDDADWGTMAGLEGACALQAPATVDLKELKQRTAQYPRLQFYVEVEA